MKAVTTNKKMGRPLKGAVRLDREISLQLDEDTLNRIDLARGNTPRAEWVRRAIDAAIGRGEQARMGEIRAVVAEVFACRCGYRSPGRQCPNCGRRQSPETAIP